MTTFNCLNPKASQTPSIGKRLVTWLVVGFLLIAAIGFAIWGQHLNPPSSSARAPAPVAGNVGSEEVAPDPEELQALAADTTAPAVRSSARAPRVPTTEVVEDDTTLVATSDKDRSFTFKRGDTASERFGKDAKKFCEHNQIADCDQVKADVEYKLPEGVTPRTAKSVKRETKKEPVRRATDTPKTNEAGEILYRRVGVAPLNGCGKRDILSIAEEAWEVLGLSQEDRAWLRLNIDQKNGPRLNLTEAEGRFDIPTGTRLEQVTFCRKGKVVKLGPMRTDWDEKQQAEGPVKGERFQLPSGQTVVWMRNCFNWVLVDIPPPPKKEEPPVTVTPPASVPVQPPTASVPPTPPVKPRLPQEEEVTVRNYDWDLGVYVGGDKDVMYAGGEGAFYPWLFYKPWGRYAVGLGAFGNIWKGETPSGYEFDGMYGAIGLAQKWSRYDGRDLGLKFPMIGLLDEHGGQGHFGQTRDAKLWCASASYNDASREKAGKTVLPEWVVWASYCDPISQSKSQHAFGYSAPSSSMKDIQHIVSVGGRVYLTKNLATLFGQEETGFAAKVQPFVEVGVNKTSPNPFSAHLYGGLRGVKKVSSIGVGPHYSATGTVLGATYNHDVGRHVKLGIEEERWTAMVTSLEALGIAVDE